MCVELLLQINSLKTITKYHRSNDPLYTSFQQLYVSSIFCQTVKYNYFQPARMNPRDKIFFDDPEIADRFEDDFDDDFDYNHIINPDLNHQGPSYQEDQNIEGDQRQKKEVNRNKYMAQKQKKIKKEVKTGSFSVRNENKSVISKDEEKKIKNRQAAKSTRRRKKEYLAKLEANQKRIQQEVEHVTKEIEQCKMEIHKSTLNNNQAIGNFDSKITHVYKKLETLIAQAENEQRNNQINVAIDSIIYRFGATGKERKGNIQESYKQIISLAPPSLHRYFLWSARDRAHIFSQGQINDNESQSWFCDMKNIIKDSLQKHPILIEKSREKITRNLQELSHLISQLRKTKNMIEAFSNVLDSLFQEIRQILTPAQSAKLIIITQKYKYRDDLQYLRGSPKILLKQQQSNLMALQQSHKFQ